MNRFALLLALAFAVHGAVSSGFGPQLREAWSAAGDYRERRVLHAFGGMDVEAIRARLDACLPTSRGVALGPEALADAFASQRLTEALYPRLIDATSPFSLEWMDSARMDPARMTALAATRGEQRLALLGPCPSGLPGETLVADRTRLAPPRLVLSAAAVAGLGLFLWALGARRARRPLALASVWLLGAMVLALLVAGATVLQAPLSWTAVRVGGVLLGGVALVRTRAVWGPALPAALGRLRREPEALVLLALLGAFTVHLGLWPVTGWDGRSIWLFHARRIFLHGMFAHADVLHLESRWSHPQYPPLLSGWLAFFGADGPVFNERSAGLALGVLLAGLLALLWRVAREELGRWVGGALTVGLFFAVQRLCAWGYADGFLALLLVLQVLGLGSARFRWEGWLAAGAAALLKQEGALLAAVFALLHLAPRVLAASSWRQRVREVLPLGLFLPAQAYVRWFAARGLGSDYAQPNWAAFLAHPLERLAAIVQALPAAAREQPALLAGLVGAGVCLAVLPAWVRRAPGARVLTALAPGVGVAFVLGVFLVTPFEQKWHLMTALDRVLLHASLLFVLAALRALTPEPAAA
ncbi:hypothetical protein [Melittangium boletus]|uniref:hypothetical protein n=1 Tax=Melittangium boletus TaxID=83453 RepID=UPI003DA452EC